MPDVPLEPVDSATITRTLVNLVLSLAGEVTR